MKNFFFYTDKGFYSKLKKLLQTREQLNTEVFETVKKIIDDVKANKDAAVLKYTEKY